MVYDDQIMYQMIHKIISMIYKIIYQILKKKKKILQIPGERGYYSVSVPEPSCYADWKNWNSRTYTLPIKIVIPGRLKA